MSDINNINNIKPNFDYDKIKRKCLKDHSRFIKSYIDHNLTNDIKQNYDREVTKYNQMKEIMRDVTIHHPRIMAHILETNSEKSKKSGKTKGSYLEQYGGNGNILNDLSNLNDPNSLTKIVKNIQSVFEIIRNTDIDKMKYKSNHLIKYMKKISDSVKTSTADDYGSNDSGSNVVINNMVVLASALNKFDQHQRNDEHNGEFDMIDISDSKPKTLDPGIGLDFLEPEELELELEKAQVIYDKIVSNITNIKNLTHKFIDTTIRIKDHLYGKYPDSKYDSIKICLMPKISDVISIIHKYLSKQTQLHQYDKILLNRLLTEYCKTKPENISDFLESYNLTMNTSNGKKIISKLNIFIAESFRQEILSFLSNSTLELNDLFKNTINSEKNARLFMNEYNALMTELQTPKFPADLRLIPCAYPIKHQDYIEKSQNDVFNKSKRTKVLHNLTRVSQDKSLIDQSSICSNPDVIVGGNSHILVNKEYTIDKMNKMIKDKRTELSSVREIYDLARVEYFKVYSDVYSYIRCMILIGTNQLSANNHVIHKYLDQDMISAYKKRIDKICDDMVNNSNNSNTRYIKRFCEVIMKRLKIFLSNLLEIVSDPEDILDVRCINSQSINSDIVLLNHFKFIIESYDK